MSTSRLAQLAALFAAAALGLFAAGPLLVQIGALPGFQGFLVFAAGLLCGLLALIFGLLGLVTTRAATGRAGRKRAIGAALTGAAILGTVLALTASTRQLPRINDITTDPADPPVFRGQPPERDMTYPPEFAAQQAAGYSDLEPIEVAGTPAQVHTRVIEAMRGLGWQILRSDTVAGEIEATDTSRVFRFVDDIAVRIRADSSGARVDVRSKSRVGKGDMGANAARIRQLRDALQ